MYPDKLAKSSYCPNCHLSKLVEKTNSGYSDKELICTKGYKTTWKNTNCDLFYYKPPNYKYLEV